MEAIFQLTQTRQVEETLQQSQTQQDSQNLIVKFPKMSVYRKRSNSESIGISDKHTAPNKMKIS
jgi:hypothetical protein